MQTALTMTTLKRPVLGTPKDTGWQYYDHHMMTSLLLGEYFDTSNYRNSIDLAMGHGKRVSEALEKIRGANGIDSDRARVLGKQAAELSSWAERMKEESFHDLHVHAFIGMWSSFEAGIENIIATYLERDEEIANRVIDLFKPKSVSPDPLPWGRASSMAVVRKLEGRAMRETPDGNVNVSARYKAMFAWLGVEFEDSETNAGRSVRSESREEYTSPQIRRN